MTDYAVHVVWNQTERAYVATCEVFPGISSYNLIREKAEAGLERLIAECVSDKKRAGEVLPTLVPSQKNKVMKKLSRDSLRADVLSMSIKGETYVLTRDLIDLLDYTDKLEKKLQEILAAKELPEVEVVRIKCPTCRCAYYEGETCKCCESTSFPDPDPLI